MQRDGASGAEHRGRNDQTLVA